MQISRPVLLLESCLTDEPIVAGPLRPLNLMPLGLFTGLPAGQIEAILLHELAHIRQIEGLGDNLYLTFIDRTGDGDYRAPANAQ